MESIDAPLQTGSVRPGLVARLAASLPRGGSLPEEVLRKRQRAIHLLLWLHVVGIPVFAAARGFSLGHGLLDASIVAVLAGVAGLPNRSRKFVSTVSALGLLSASAILVHLSGGTIEMHFHFFVMIGILTLYEDWLPFLVAVGFVLVHHGVMGMLDSDSVYNHPAARNTPFLWAAIHAMFVAGAGTVSIVAWRLSEDVRRELAESSRRLSESEERFRKAFESAPIGMALVGLDGRFLRVNRSLCEMVGRREHELVGASFLDITHPEDVDVSRQAWQGLLSGSAASVHVEKRNLHADEHVVWVLLSSSAVPDPQGRPLHFVSQMEDITERKRAEDERQRLLDRIVSASEEERMHVAAELHDGPIQHLTAIDMRLERVRSHLEGTDAAVSAELAERVQECLREEIHGLRRMMSELRPPALDEQGLEAALRDYADNVVAESGLVCSVESRLKGRIPPALETILYRAAQESLTNVIKHAGAQRAWLSVQATNGKVELVVRDDGGGFDVEEVRDRGGQNHFGLIAMRERVTAAGGTLRVTSRPGEGTRIHIALPVN